MPNRVIKDSIHTSEKVNRMTDFQFRLWVSLIAYVDDYGRGDARPAVIRGACFPLRERLTNKDIDAALTGLAGIGCIGLYEVDGRPYLYFPNWEKHQRIQTKRSRYPAPEESTVIHREPPLESNPIQSESKSESKGETRARAFTQPTREEGTEYYKAQGCTFSLDAWFAYYEQNGWMVGNRKMKDWKASMRYWQTKEPTGKKPMNQTAKGFDSAEDAKAKVERMRKVAAAMQKEAGT